MKTSADLLNDRNVLIVDDDPRNTLALASYLEYSGMKIYTAATGFEAITLLHDNNSIHIILMDIMMPEMDGFEATEKIKGNRLTEHIPIIAVTAKAMSGDREKCLACGANEYISKPVNLHELLEKMARVLNPS